MPSWKKLVKKYWDTGASKPLTHLIGFVATLTPDCELPEKVFFTRHRIQGDDAYFISNQNDTPVTAKAIFRITGKQPELWNPVTGKRIDAPHWKKMADGRTEVTLDMEGAARSLSYSGNRLVRKVPQPGCSGTVPA